MGFYMGTQESITQQIAEADPNAIKAWLTDGLLPSALDLAVKVVLAFVIFFIGTRLIKVARKLLKRFLERTKAETGVKQFLDSLVKMVLYFLLIVLICGWFGISTASIVAVLSSAGLAIGLALQGSLSNFAGGVLILVLKPFKVGDYIIEDTNENEGIVTEIQLFYTKLRTFDNQIIIIPNGTLANTSLTNVSEQDKRRVDLLVGISYEADLKQAKEVLMQMLEGETRRLEGEPCQVYVRSLDASSVQIACRVWVKTEDYWKVKWDLTEKMKLTLDEHGIEIPFNQLEVRMK